MKKLDKLNSIEGISKYFCSECNHFHIRKYRYKINKLGHRIKTKDTPFFNHKEFAYKLTSSELWKRQFGRSCELYSIKEHKKAIGSNKR